MIQMFSKKLKNKKGVTLVELIVVIAVIGILAGIAVPKFSGFTDKAKKATDDQLIAVIKKGLQMDWATEKIKDTTITVTVKKEEPNRYTPHVIWIKDNKYIDTEKLLKTYTDEIKFQHYEGKIEFKVAKDGTVTSNEDDTDKDD
ncbi:type II secretion system protein [Inediibacterium massiliense]|uniref:type II secretion system protein n=1 Tax=Inediibacterium massiliense TaxID=1658111 RepID=UPI0006B53CE3|nr:type II secretion system protein [Inediibacterium massiliense]